MGSDPLLASKLRMFRVKEDDFRTNMFIGLTDEVFVVNSLSYRLGTFELSKNSKSDMSDNRWEKRDLDRMLQGLDNEKYEEIEYKKWGLDRDGVGQKVMARFNSKEFVEVIKGVLRTTGIGTTDMDFRAALTVQKDYPCIAATFKGGKKVAAWTVARMDSNGFHVYRNNGARLLPVISEDLVIGDGGGVCVSVEKVMQVIRDNVNSIVNPLSWGKSSKKGVEDKVIRFRFSEAIPRQTKIRGKVKPLQGLGAVPQHPWW